MNSQLPRKLAHPVSCAGVPELPDQFGSGAPPCGTDELERVVCCLDQLAPRHWRTPHQLVLFVYLFVFWQS